MWSDCKRASKMGDFSKSVTLKICRIGNQDVYRDGNPNLRLYGAFGRAVEGPDAQVRFFHLKKSLIRSFTFKSITACLRFKPSNFK